MMSLRAGKGFRGIVVYGALIVAKVSHLIGMKLPGRDSLWTSIRLDFVKPLYVNQPARVEGLVLEVSSSTGIDGFEVDRFRGQRPDCCKG